MAVLLWAFVNSQTNVQVEDVYSNVPVEISELGEGLVVTNRPPGVQVRIQGSRSALANLSSQDIRAIVDMRDVSPGNNILAVNAIVPSGIEIVSIRPSQVNLIVDSVEERKFPVSIELVGEFPEELNLAEPLVKPEEVFVKGARETLNRVDRVIVTVELDDQLESDQTLNLPLEVVNQAGVAMGNLVETRPQWVEVFFPIAYNTPDEEAEDDERDDEVTDDEITNEPSEAGD